MSLTNLQIAAERLQSDVQDIGCLFDSNPVKMDRVPKVDLLEVVSVAL